MKTFIWTDRAVLAFAKVNTQGPHGEYEGCKSQASKMERFKQIYREPEFCESCGSILKED